MWSRDANLEERLVKVVQYQWSHMEASLHPRTANYWTREDPRIWLRISRPAEPISRKLMIKNISMPMSVKSNCVGIDAEFRGSIFLDIRVAYSGGSQS